MVHVIYDVNSMGHSVAPQVGEGDGEPKFYTGVRYQRGYGHPQYGRGVMGVLSKVWKYLVPLAKKHLAPLASEAVKAVGEEGIGAGQKFLSEISKGKDAKEAVVTEGTQALKNLMKRAGTRLQQKGSGKKKKTGGAKRARSVANLHLVGRSLRDNALLKNSRNQNLGLY